MATETEIVKGLNDYLRASGNICGRNYADVGGAVRSIQGSLTGETEQSLRQKVDAIISKPVYGFKSRNDGKEVSASDPICGS